MVSWQAFPSLPPSSRAPRVSLAHKTPFLFPSNACHAGYDNLTFCKESWRAGPSVIQHSRKTLHSRIKENRLVIQIQGALWRKLQPLFSRNKKALRFKRGQRKCACIRGQILPTRNNNYSKSICMSWPLSVKHAAKITFAQCKCRTFQSIIYPADENKFIEISSTLAWGKRRVGLPPPFIAKNLSSYLYMLINGRHTHRLHVPFLFHWQIFVTRGKKQNELRKSKLL